MIMKAIIQNFGRGDLAIAEIPAPALRPGGVLVRNEFSLVSPGTERLMAGLAQKSLLGKAQARPDLVRQVFEKALRDGFLATVEAVRHRLDSLVPLGYSSAGTVIAVGEGAQNFAVGDRVACAGTGYANHAEMVFIPRNLAARIPESVDFESASFTTVGAVALQGLRLADAQIGGTLAVIGLGLIGLIMVQLGQSGGVPGCRDGPESRPGRACPTIGGGQRCGGW